jgi:uncharacterized protein (TIGR00369 family)
MPAPVPPDPPAPSPAGTPPSSSPDEATVAATREAWRVAERDVLARLAAGAGSGAVPRELLTGLDGLALMQRMLAGEVAGAPIGRTLGFALVEVGPGRAVFQGTPGAGHLNPMGTVHGGWYATLLDSAVGCAVHTLMPAGRGYTTAELSVNLVRAAFPDREPLRAIGQVLHAGRQLATAEGRLVDAAGRLYAHATTTCLVFDLPPAR